MGTAQLLPLRLWFDLRRHEKSKSRRLPRCLVLFFLPPPPRPNALRINYLASHATHDDTLSKRAVRSLRNLTRQVGWTLGAAKTNGARVTVQKLKIYGDDLWLENRCRGKLLKLTFKLHRKCDVACENMCGICGEERKRRRR